MANNSQRIAQAKKGNNGIHYHGELYFPKRFMDPKGLQYLRHSIARFEADVQALDGIARFYLDK